MTGTVELSRDGAFLVIRFPYREDLVLRIKSLPDRRWDPKNKEWRVPVRLAEQVYKLLANNLFDFSPEVMSQVAGTLGTKPKPAPAPSSGEATAPADPAAATAVATDDTAQALSISALNQRIKEVLRGGFTQTFWVVGEVVDFDKSAGKQHRFFQLVEKQPGEARHRATITAALFERTGAMLQKKLAQGPNPMTLRDGIEIRALVKVDFYEQSGRLQVVVEDIDPSFTLGKLALTREQILAELRDMGLATRNLALGLPVPPLRIGVLTSPESDGWNDFLRHLQEARVPLVVTLVPVKVQGTDLKPSMLAGLQWFAARAAEFDALCILRGGGSRNDLAWFDDRDLAVAVARHPLKILVGIGHQRDQSVLDVIAHSEKTPTALAQFLVARVDESREAVRQLGDRLATAATDLLAGLRRQLLGLGRELVRAPVARLQDERLALTLTARGLQTGTMLRLERQGHDLRTAAARARAGAVRAVDLARHRLEQQATRQRLLDPVRVLGRGFALLRDEAGKVLPAAARLRQGQTFTAWLRDGSVRAKVEDIRTNPQR